MTQVRENTELLVPTGLLFYLLGESDAFEGETVSADDRREAGSEGDQAGPSPVGASPSEEGDAK